MLQLCHFQYWKRTLNVSFLQIRACKTCIYVNACKRVVINTAGNQDIDLEINTHINIRRHDPHCATVRHCKQNCTGKYNNGKLQHLPCSRRCSRCFFLLFVARVAAVQQSSAPFVAMGEQYKRRTLNPCIQKTLFFVSVNLGAWCNRVVHGARVSQALRDFNAIRVWAVHTFDFSETNATQRQTQPTRLEHAAELTERVIRLDCSACRLRVSLD